VHQLYCDAASNPFYDPGMPLESPNFVKEIKKIAIAPTSPPPPLPQTAAI
jgi:hypothetical protein